MKNHLLLIFSLLFNVVLHPAHGQSDSLKFQSPELNSLQPLIDSLVVDAMARYRIPGAVITIVQDSSQVFSKGYGYADLENKILVDAEKTIFRIASITKTFTALAAMQLVDDGKLDLHTDIRNYLPDEDFEFLTGDPITMHQLLTHTAGFDITDTRDAALTPDGVTPLEELARKQMPDQVLTPGETYSYSNFGYALAGYIIQEISGILYESYIQEYLLDPLEMSNTGITQPLPPHLKKNLSKSYVWNGEQVELDRDYTNTLPGGGIISSGQDMANYLLMHLNGGEFNNIRLVSEAGHDALTNQQFGSRDTKYGICYAFTENMWSGYRTIEHTGGQLGFLSMFLLAPETGTGIFISHNNRKGSGGFRYDIVREVLNAIQGSKDRKIAPISPPSNFDSIAHRYTGTYRQANYPHNTFEKVSQLFGAFANETQVEYDGEGRLIIFGDPFIQVDEHLFQIDHPTSNYKVEFLVNENGKADRIFAGINSYDKAAWYQRKRPKQLAMIIGMSILLIQFLLRPIMWLWKRLKKKHENKNESWVSTWRYWTGSLFIIASIGFLGSFIVYEDQLSDYGVPLILKMVFLINTIGFASAFASPYAIWQTLTSELKIAPKIWQLLVTTSIIIVAVIFFHFRMVGFQYY